MFLYKKIKDYLEMYPPTCADSKGWKEFNLKCEKNYPIRYWLNEKLIPNIWWPITRFFSNIRYWIRFRFFEKMYIIKTDLKPDYYDSETRMLYGMFSLLKDFVEIEKAWMQAIFAEDYKKPWYPFKRFRSKTKGLLYLDWEISLQYEKSDNKGIIEGHKRQSKAAQIVKDLYIWWVEIRPQRMDPYDLIPDDSSNKKVKNFLDDLTSTIPDELKKIYTKIDKIEKEYQEEDTAMLIKLIKNRESMWT